MRAPRLALLASASLLVAAGAAHAQDPAPAAPPAPQTAPADAMTPAPGGFTDQELKKFDDAMTQVRAVSDTLNGAQPTPEQQAQMASAIQDSGLEVTRFNAISTAVSSDPELAARIAVLNTAPPAPGTPAASVTDDELTRYVTAMTQIRAVTAEVENGQATPEQSAQLTAAVQGSGLEVERFNTIAQVVSQDDYLQAKAQLIGARAEKGVSQ
ncbi:DUF4168 domain-containing protein [Brevundimonas sp.]|uniref:DUF4168 domain-containing protein n=1 Tax=Brevundimonas sp. TaxID=1871086 RepID=UPI0019906A09|nr:DUF4168 domain-containing protein [Brevundimonas sp.]MBD3837688.1 DUF4168 domain-containing protein [Brevundimonas sp.]